MKKTQAHYLRAQLACEAKEAGLPHLYSLRESANDPEVFAVLESLATPVNTPVALWVSPDLSFPIPAIG